MKNPKKKGINFVFLIFIFILIRGISKEYNFDTNTFDNIWLALLYGITLVGFVVLLIIDFNKPADS